MASQVNNSKSFFDLYFRRVAKGFFLYSIWVGNIFINTKDIIPKSEART